VGKGVGISRSGRTFVEYFKIATRWIAIPSRASVSYDPKQRSSKLSAPNQIERASLETHCERKAGEPSTCRPRSTFKSPSACEA
jgi:hypothetical protein